MRLQIEREARKWSKSELARRAGLNHTTVGQIESGRFRPYPGQLRKLAFALGLPERDAHRLLEDGSNTDGLSGRGSREPEAQPPDSADR